MFKILLLMMMVHQNRFFNLFNGIDDLSVEDWKNKTEKEANLCEPPH